METSKGASDASDKGMEAEVILRLAEQAISIKGLVGALVWAAGLSVDETKGFTSLVSVDQTRGDGVVKMTPKVIKAYNHMVWGQALLLTVKLKFEEAKQKAQMSGEVSETVN